MSARCEVCRGEQLIRVPLYRQSVVTFDFDPAAVSQESFRTYPCPECAPGASVERVKVIEAHALIRVEQRLIEDADFMRNRREHIAHMLVGELLRANLIEFRHRKENPKSVGYARDPEWELMATVAVISIKDRKSMEDRVAEHQAAFAVEVVAEATKEIDAFGQTYGWQHIDKNRARAAMTRALLTVEQRRQTRKVA